MKDLRSFFALRNGMKWRKNQKLDKSAPLCYNADVTNP